MLLQPETMHGEINAAVTEETNQRSQVPQQRDAAMTPNGPPQSISMAVLSAVSSSGCRFWGKSPGLWCRWDCKSWTKGEGELALPMSMLPLFCLLPRRAWCSSCIIDAVPSFDTSWDFSVMDILCLAWVASVKLFTLLLAYISSLYQE